MRVLIAVDGSESADGAVRWYFKVHREGNEVILGHATDLPAHVAFGYNSGSAMQPERYEKMRAIADEEYQKLKVKYSKLFDEHKLTSTLIRMEGSPGDALCTLAKDKDVDMIIIGTRGLGTVRRTLLGSVSDYVLHHSHVPVSICHKGYSWD